MPSATVWTTVPYDPARFTAVEATWTVPDGAAASLRYVRLDMYTVVVTFDLGNTTVSAPTTQLRIHLPPGLFARSSTGVPCLIDDANTFRLGSAFLGAGGGINGFPTIQVYQFDGAGRIVPFEPGRTLGVQGQLVYEVDLGQPINAPVNAT